MQQAKPKGNLYINGKTGKTMRVHPSLMKDPNFLSTRNLTKVEEPRPFRAMTPIVPVEQPFVAPAPVEPEEPQVQPETDPGEGTIPETNPEPGIPAKKKGRPFKTQSHK